MARLLKELSKVEQRYDAVVAVIRDGFSVTEVARKFGVSRQSLYRWMARYEDGGLEALAERSHRPRCIPHQIPAELEARVLELRRIHPHWDPITFQDRLRKDGVAFEDRWLRDATRIDRPTRFRSFGSGWQIKTANRCS